MFSDKQDLMLPDNQDILMPDNQDAIVEDKQDDKQLEMQSVKNTMLEVSSEGPNQLEATCFSSKLPSFYLRTSFTF